MMMVKRWMATTILATVGVGMAMGQDSKPTGVMVRIGSFMPSSLQARNASATWMLFGVQVDLKSKGAKSANGHQSSLALSVDTYSKGSLSAVPIMLNFVTQEGKICYSFGLGGSYDREVRNTFQGEEKSSRIELAYQFSLGYDVSRYGFPGILEAKYFGNGYDTLSGFALCLGFRF